MKQLNKMRRDVGKENNNNNNKDELKLVRRTGVDFEDRYRK